MNEPITDDTHTDDTLAYEPVSGVNELSTDEPATGANEPVKVMIVDDHESVRNLFEYEFCPENGFRVVASLASADNAELACYSKCPELILMDVCTEYGASGLEAAERILKEFPDVKIIMTSGFDEFSYSVRAKELGAHAFIYKIESSEYYREVAKQVLEGEYVFPEPKKIPLPQGEAPFTNREMEILRLKCQCLKNAEISSRLFISELTVNRHIQNMLHKSGYSSIAELMIYVVSNGWINPNY